MLQTYTVDIELCRTHVFAVQRLCIYHIISIIKFELTEKCACGCFCQKYVQSHTYVQKTIDMINDELMRKDATRTVQFVKISW